MTHVASIAIRIFSAQSIELAARCVFWCNGRSALRPFVAGLALVPFSCDPSRSMPRSAPIFAGKPVPIELPALCFQGAERPRTPDEDDVLGAFLPEMIEG